MARSSEIDPVSKCRFDIQIIAVSLAPGAVINNFTQGGISQFARIGFVNADVPEMTTTVMEYRENTDNPAPRKIAGLAKFNDITLSRGVLSNFNNKDNNTKDFYRWVTEVQGFNPGLSMLSDLLGTSRNKPLTQSENYRKDLIIVARDREGKAARRWYIVNAFPKVYKGGDGLDAKADDMLIESITLTYELAFELPSAFDAAKDMVAQIVSTAYSDSAAGDVAGAVGDLNLSR